MLGVDITKIKAEMTILDIGFFSNENLKLALLPTRILCTHGGPARGPRARPRQPLSEALHLVSEMWLCGARAFVAIDEDATDNAADATKISDPKLRS